LLEWQPGAMHTTTHSSKHTAPNSAEGGRGGSLRLAGLNHLSWVCGCVAVFHVCEGVIHAISHHPNPRGCARMAWAYVYAASCAHARMCVQEKGRALALPLPCFTSHLRCVLGAPYPCGR